MFVITNGFTYIAFLMFVAGALLFLQKNTKWKVFDLVPPLVWIYVLHMIFCTFGLYDMAATKPAYSSFKNNLLYAMIFVMLLRCDFRKLGKLGPRMIAIFLGCSLTLAIGTIVAYPVFMNVIGGGEKTWAAEHVVGVAKGVDERIIMGLRENFNGECCEVGMYLAMARVAHREGYPEIGLYWEKAAYEEAEHAAKFAELLGEVVTDSTKKNLEMRVDAENGATLGKFELAKHAKELGLDAIHDTVHEMARDEARHGKAFAGLLKRYFG